MKPKHRRLAIIATVVIGLGAATILVMSALEENVVFFMSPSDLAAREAPPSRAIRVGGLVEPGSVNRDGALADFVITDGSARLAVSYKGTLPDLFREGQGVVAEGMVTGPGMFTATEVLAKHDETYMPPEVADALKRSGHWQSEVGQATTN